MKTALRQKFSQSTMGRSLKAAALIGGLTMPAFGYPEEAPKKDLHAKIQTIQNKLAKYKQERELRECDEITDDNTEKKDLFQVDNHVSIEFDSAEECHAYDKKPFPVHHVYYPQMRVWQGQNQKEAAAESWNKIRVPRDLRPTLKLVSEIEGIPPELYYSIMYPESSFKCTDNPYSTAGDCFHLLRNTKYEKIKETQGTLYERFFPVASLIRTGRYLSNNNTRYHIENPYTGLEDRNLTLNYHSHISSVLFLETILASFKFKDDYKVMTNAGIQPTGHDSYAQWFYGTYTGLEFGKYRRNIGGRSRHDPIINIYGKTQETAFARGAQAIFNIGNRNLFFQKDFAEDAMLKLNVAIQQELLAKPRMSPQQRWALEQHYYTKIAKAQLASENYKKPFKSVAQVETYFAVQKKIPDQEWYLKEGNPDLLAKVKIMGGDIDSWLNTHQIEAPDPQSPNIEEPQIRHKYAYKQMELLKQEL